MSRSVDFSDLSGKPGEAPRRLGLAIGTVADLAARYAFELRHSIGSKDKGPAAGGHDEVNWLLPLSSVSSESGTALVYYEDPSLSLPNVRNQVFLVTEELAHRVPADNMLLVTEQPYTSFYTILADLVEGRKTERLCGRIDATARIATSADIEDNVVIEAGAEIGAFVYIGSNTYIGKNVKVKPHATIGSNGFEIATITDARRIVPHAGGVWLEAGVEIGASTCIDKGLFGEFTYIGSGSKVDNLVHIAHAVSIGQNCSIVACSQIAGSARLEDGCWVGPNASINQHLRLGKGCYVGGGTTVLQDIEPHTWVTGNPGRALGVVCLCKTKLSVSNHKAVCGRCASRFEVIDGKVRLLEV